MKLIYILLIVITACGKKNDFSSPRFFSEVKDEPSNNGIIPKDARLWLSLNGGAIVEVDWELKSSIRNFFLEEIAANKSNTDIPDRLDYFFDLSSQKIIWENILNENNFEKMYLELEPSSHEAPQMELGWHKTGNVISSRHMPVRNNELLEGKAFVTSIGGDKQHMNLMRTHYRVILSMPKGDEVYYVTPNTSLKDFLALHQISLKDLPQHWYSFNLPDGIHSPVGAGKSYALVYATDSQLRERNNNILRKVQDLKHNPTFLFPKNTGKSLLTLFFPPYQYLDTKEETLFDGSTPYRGGHSYNCRYQRVTALGYRSINENSAKEILSFVNTSTNTPLAFWNGARILWEVAGVGGTVVQLEIDNSLNVDSLIASSRVNEVVRVGDLGGAGCRSPENGNWQNQYLRENVKMAAFLTEMSNY